jgi:DNA-binding MarR family transcriptional regulator
LSSQFAAGGMGSIMTAFDSIARIISVWLRERPDLDGSAVGIHGRIIRLASHMLRRSDGWLNPLGLSWEAFSLIVTLRRSGKPYELRPTDILKESLLTSGAVTNRIDRVEEMGLVKRIPAKGDRRSYSIRLTPAGKRLADKAIEHHFVALKRSFNSLTDSEQKQLASLLEKLLSAAEAQEIESSARKKFGSRSSLRPTAQVTDV